MSWLASIEELSRMDMLCSDKSGMLTQNIMTIESKLPWCETSEQGLLSFALLASEWTQNAKDVFDTMLFKSKQEVQADLGPSHVSLTRFSIQLSRRQNPLLRLVVTIMRGSRRMWVRKCCRILNGASGVQASHSSDADGKLVSRGNLTFSDPQRPDTKRRNLWSRRTRYSSEHDHGRPRRDWEGNVSLDWYRNKDSHDQGHPTLRDRFGELVEGCDGFAGVHPEHKLQIVQVLKSRG